jgi:hypothetical protein
MINALILMLLLGFSPLPAGRSPGSRNAHPRAQAQQPTIRDLMAEGPAPELKDKLMLFGQFVGDWKFQQVTYLPKGKTVKGDGCVYFGWILHGTAIQGVWTDASDHPMDFGTDVRFYDPKIDAWQVTWMDPVAHIVQRLVARKVGDTIVLDTKSVNGGNPERWIFSEITPQTFHWHSEESHDGGKTWVLTQDLHAQKIVSEK